MEQVKKEMQGGNVMKAKRLQTKSGVKSDCLSVLLVFMMKMPNDVNMGWLNFKIREKILQTLRCIKCQIMGHTVQQCKLKQRRAKCGGKHDYGKCNKDAKLKCCNCGGVRKH